MKRFLTCLVLSFALCLPSQPVQAGLLSALAKAAKAGKVGKAAKAGKGVKAASGAKLATKGVAVAAVAYGGAEWAAMRSARVFSGLSDEAAAAARYVTKDLDGSYRVLSKSGNSQVVAVSELTQGVTGPIYIDLPAAVEPQMWKSLGDADVFVLDHRGNPVQAIRVAEEGRAGEFLVDRAGDLVDIGSFAAEEVQAAQAQETPDDPIATSKTTLVTFEAPKKATPWYVTALVWLFLLAVVVSVGRTLYSSATFIRKLFGGLIRLFRKKQPSASTKSPAE